MAGKIGFVVQGEGRGHLSQAIALTSILAELDYEVAVVWVGRSSQRKLPPYFTTFFEGKILEFSSPNFSMDKNKKGINVIATLWQTLKRARRYVTASRSLIKSLNSECLDGIVNFYEPLLGFGSFFWGVKSPVVCIAHQYLTLHPDFEMPATPRFDKAGLKFLSWISQRGSKVNLALSFYPFPDFKQRHIKVVPPLLRPMISELEVKHDGFYLIYILNSGYAENVIKWHNQHSVVELHCFWDRFEMPNPLVVNGNLFFHHLSDTLFLEKLASCSAFLTTAGFESVSEAIYLGKKVAMIPVQGHYEQKLNSFDALKANAGIRMDEFDLFKIIPSLEAIQIGKNADAKDWMNQSTSIIKGEISRAFNK